MLISWVKLWYLALNRHQNQPTWGVLSWKTGRKIDSASGPSFLLARKHVPCPSSSFILLDITSKYTRNKQKTNKQTHRCLSYCNQWDNGCPLNSNYDHDTTLTSNSIPASAIAVVGIQWFGLCYPQRESQPTNETVKIRIPRIKWNHWQQQQQQQASLMYCI